MSGNLAKVSASTSMPVEIGRSVCGHLISKTAMGPSLLTSFAKVTSQSAIWRVERLLAIMDRSSVTSVTFKRCSVQKYPDADNVSASRRGYVGPLGLDCLL